MLTVKEGNTFAFVPSNARRDENEREGIMMYDYDPTNNTVAVLFDGHEWLGPKPSVEPEP